MTSRRQLRNGSALGGNLCSMNNLKFGGFMSPVKVKRFAQVTIPADIRGKANIEQGDFVEMIYETGKIIITPQRVTDKT